jgi:uncharacterized coiled-coil protein SlyX
MDLKFECPSCGQHLSATRSQIGVTAPCPNCDAAVTVPKTSTLPHPREKKRRKTTVILIENSAVAPSKAKEVKKWTDDPAEARNWLIDRLSEIHAGKYLAGIFDQNNKPGSVPVQPGAPQPAARFQRQAMLKDKVEKLEATVAQLKSTVAKQEATIAQQQKGMDAVTVRLNEQASQIQKMSAQLEATKPARQVVNNP